MYHAYPDGHGSWDVFHDDQPVAHFDSLTPLLKRYPDAVILDGEPARALRLLRSVAALVTDTRGEVMDALVAAGVRPCDIKTIVTKATR